MTAALAPDLGDAVADFAAGMIDAAQFGARFATSTVYAIRPAGRPALAAYRIGERLAAPVFSSLTALARWHAQTTEERAHGVDWFALTGADLLAGWPPACDLVIDPGSPGAVRQPAECMRRADVLTVREQPTEPG